MAFEPGEKIKPYGCKLARRPQFAPATAALLLSMAVRASAQPPKKRRLRTNCETIHFSPLSGGRPACTERKSGSPDGNAFTKNKPSPRVPLWHTLNCGKSVSPPA